MLALVVAVVSSAVVVGAGTGASAAAFTGPHPASVGRPFRRRRLVTPDRAGHRLHYAPNGNFSTTGTYLPGSDGFNIADASSIAQVDSLPVGVKALVYLGLCDGADTNFIDLVQQFIGNPDVYGFYLVDEPDPTGEYSPQCPATDLKAESDWIHANDPGTVTVHRAMNLGTPTQPDFMDTYNSANTDIDLFGLDPYPCMKELHGCDNDVIGLSVSAALASGLTTDQIVPVYQAFGGGGYRQWTVPTPAEELEILSTWRSLTPDPAFDFAYSWGQQSSDRSLQNEPKLQAVFDQPQNGVPAAAPSRSPPPRCRPPAGNPVPRPTPGGWRCRLPTGRRWPACPRACASPVAGRGHLPGRRSRTIPRLPTTSRCLWCTDSNRGRPADRWRHPVAGRRLTDRQGPSAGDRTTPNRRRPLRSRPVSGSPVGASRRIDRLGNVSPWTNRSC